MQIPFVNTTRYLKKIQADVMRSMSDIIDSGQLVCGPIAASLENDIESYLGVRCCVLTNSCTDALTASLVSIGIESGDYVLVPSLSFVATLNAVRVIGAIPIFADVNEMGSGYDLHCLETTLRNNSKIKAIVAVHLFGHPFDISLISATAKKFGISMVEDCAQWFTPFSQFAFGDNFLLRCFSFDPTKNIFSIGSLGAIVTNDFQIASRLKAIRSHGIHLPAHQVSRLRGMNSRPSELNAAVVKRALVDQDSREQARKAIARRYVDFAASKDVEIISPLLPSEYSTWNKFVILVDNPERTMFELEQKGIQSKRHYDYLLPEVVGVNDAFPNGTRIRNRALSIPLFPEMFSEEVEIVIGAMNDMRIT